ncbi:MAG: MGH1-like glycoside hydrolase domain-containing protein [Candidatus Helarchaeota archaeon]
MSETGEAQKSKMKGYILGLSFASVAGLLLGWAAPLLELANEAGNALEHPYFYIAILIQLLGGLLNFFALSYLRPAIVFPVYGSIQIFESVIIAQILLPLTNPWHNLFIASLILILISLLLIAYSISKKPEEEVVDLLPPAPSIEIEETVNSAFADIFKILDLNLMGAYGRIKHRWAHSGHKYTHPLLSESCFTSLIWNLWVPEIAQEILLPFLDGQAENGRIPSKVKMFGKQYREILPLLAHTIVILNPSMTYLQEIYPKLKKFHQWIYQNRQNEDGLFFWKTPEESGMPESQRFAKLKDCSHIIPVDLNSYVVLQNKALAKITNKLGLQEEAAYYEKQTKDLCERIQAKLWDSESQMYYDWDSTLKAFIKNLALSNFIPLAAQIPTKPQAAALISHLQHPEKFNTPTPLPSISIADKAFRSQKWKGAVSINLAYLILQGLDLYLEQPLVVEFGYRLIKGILTKWSQTGTFYEFYSPNPIKYPLATKPSKDYVGSTGLINVILVEMLLGIKFQNDKIWICPKLPDEWKNKKIRYSIPIKKFSLDLEWGAEAEIRVELRYYSKKEAFVLKNFEEKCITIS